MIYCIEIKMSKPNIKRFAFDAFLAIGLLPFIVISAANSITVQTACSGIITYAVPHSFENYMLLGGMFYCFFWVLSTMIKHKVNGDY